MVAAGSDSDGARGGNDGIGGAGAGGIVTGGGASGGASGNGGGADVVVVGLIRGMFRVFIVADSVGGGCVIERVREVG